MRYFRLEELMEEYLMLCIVEKEEDLRGKIGSEIVICKSQGCHQVSGTGDRVSARIVRTTHN